MIHNHEVPSSILGPATFKNKAFVGLPPMGVFSYFYSDLTLSLTYVYIFLLFRLLQVFYSFIKKTVKIFIKPPVFLYGVKQ